MLSTPIGLVPRVPACSLCQARKVKCDRENPCSACVRANAKCTPSVPAPPRKRRRPNQILQERLARCEELLSHHANIQPSNSCEEASKDIAAASSPGRLILDDGGVLQFTDSSLWATVQDELHAMKQIVDNEGEEDDYSTPSHASSLGEDGRALMLNISIGSAEELQPQPAQLTLLWHIFLDRVNPLTKVVHVPTLQPMLLEATINPSRISKTVETLISSIHLMAVVSMTDSECQAQFGSPRATVLDRYSERARISFARVNLLTTKDLVVLQALILYSISLCSRYEHHAAWVLNGTIVRIAKKMGLHRDGELLGLPPFETEMRRRIWWQIFIFDSNSALMSGLRRSVLLEDCDTRKPMNINDSDLFPGMTTPKSSEGPTDMIFCLCNIEIREFFAKAPKLADIVTQLTTSNPDHISNSNELGLARTRINELDQCIGSLLDRHGDLSAGPVHEFSFKTRSVLVTKLQGMIRYPAQNLDIGQEIPAPNDNLFKMSVSMVDRSIGWYQACFPGGNFLWFAHVHFHMEILIYMVGQLASRTSGQLVEHAWTALDLVYSYNHQLFDLAIKPHAHLANHILRVWPTRQKVLHDRTGSKPTTPFYIMKLEALLTSAGSKPQSSGGTTPSIVVVDATDTGQGASTLFLPPWDQNIPYYFDGTNTDSNLFMTSGETGISYGGSEWMPMSNIVYM